MSRSTTRRPSLGGAGDQVREAERRHDEQHLQLLREEPEADERARRDDPSPPAVIDRAQRRVRGERHEEHEQRVGVVEPEHERGDWCRRHHGPAIRPAAAESLRRTAAYTTATVATPISAWGTRMLHELRPNARTDRPMIQSDAGGLSTVIELAASNDPKNHAFQLCDPACAAAE